MPYQSVTLTSISDVVYIPKNAKVVGIDKSGTLDVDSTCIDLDNAEDFTCYAIVCLTQNDNGGHTEPLQVNNINFTGVVVDGKSYSFPSVSFDDFRIHPEILYNAIKNISAIGSLFKDFDSLITYDSDYGFKTYIIFKTIPSIGNTTQLISSTTFFGGANAVMEYRLPAILRDTLYANGSTDVPECISSSSSAT